MTQLDPEVMAALPPEVQEEIRMAYPPHRTASPSPSALGAGAGGPGPGEAETRNTETAGDAGGNANDEAAEVVGEGEVGAPGGGLWVGEPPAWLGLVERQRGPAPLQQLVDAV